MRRRAGVFPVDARDQPAGRGVRCKTASHDAIFGKNRADASGIVHRIEAPRFGVAEHQFARESRIIGVLAERVVAAGGGPRLKTARAQLCDVGSTDFRRSAFHWKPERVAETLPDEAAAKLVKLRHSAGARIFHSRLFCKWLTGSVVHLQWRAGRIVW